MRTLRN
jgi:spore germination cell wall hydrolase CwlJ-like protein